jgi:predicted membrane-bound spermidine synthase
MSDSHDERARDDDEWNYRARHETETQRLDRNWAGLLQELRVVQTGVQLLTGFLLTLPFQQRFADLTDFEVGVYLVTVALSVLSTMLLIAPAGIHRALFRQHALPALVSTAHKLTLCGIATLGAALVGVVLLIFSFVVSPRVGLVAAAVAAAIFCGLSLLATILRLRHRIDDEPPTRG